MLWHSSTHEEQMNASFGPSTIGPASRWLLPQKLHVLCRRRFSPLGPSGPPPPVPPPPVGRVPFANSIASPRASPRLPRFYHARAVSAPPAAEISTAPATLL